jgi:hypothetical protein
MGDRWEVVRGHPDADKRGCALKLRPEAAGVGGSGKQGPEQQDGRRGVDLRGEGAMGCGRVTSAQGGPDHDAAHNFWQARPAEAGYAVPLVVPFGPSFFG